MAEIDSLEIRIQGTAQAANRAIDSIGIHLKNLEKSLNFNLGGLEKLGEINTGNLSKLGDGLKGLSEGIKTFKEIEKKDFNIISSNIKKIASIEPGNIQVVGESLKPLSEGIKSLTDSLANAEKVQTNTISITNAVTKLAQTGTSIGTVTSQLPAFGNALNEFIKDMSQVATVTPSTISFTQAIATLAGAGKKATIVANSLEPLGKELKNFFKEMSTVPVINANTVRMTEALAKLANAAGKAKSSINTLPKSFNALSVSSVKVSKSIKGMQNNFTNLVKSILPLVGLHQLFEFGKKAITSFSDLAEAQNVVEQGFGKLVSKIDNFSKSAITSFGMSELAAKNTAGIYAVLGKSLGLLPEKATDMAVSLTGLSGDLASFYNVSQDVAKTALQSVFTGETESLKRFGVVLTEANLQQFAYAQGIEKSIRNMTQAEKVQLRYAYTMQATSNAHGDFAKTSGSWANQIRILSEQFNKLAGVVGGVLVSAFLPAVKGINNVIAKIIQLAEVVASFTSKLFGLKNPITSSGAGLSQIADAAGSVSNSMGEAIDGIAGVGSAANKSKKQMNRFAASWHEINNMSSTDNEAAAGASGVGTGGIQFPEVSLPEMNLPNEIEIDVNAKDNTTSVFDRIKNRFAELGNLFQKGFSIGFGDISALDTLFENVKGIGQSIKNIFTDEELVNSSNKFLDTFSLNLGKVSGSFTSIGTTIALNLTGGLENYLTENEDKITSHFVKMFDITGEITEIVGNFSVAFANIFEAFRGEDAINITSDVIQIFSDSFMGVTELATKLGRDVLGLILNPITENAEGIKLAIENTLKPLEEMIGTIADSVTMFWEEANKVYDEHVKPMFEAFTGGITEIIGSLTNGYNEHIAPVLDSLSKKFSEVWKGTIDPLIKNAIGLIGDVADLIKDFWNNVLQPTFNWIAQNIMPLIAPVLEWLGETFINLFEDIGNIVDGFIGTAKGLIQFLDGAFTGDWEKAWNGVVGIFEGIRDRIEGVADAIGGFIKDILEGVAEAFSAITGLNKETEISYSGTRANRGKSFSGIAANLSSIRDIALPSYGVSYELADLPKLGGGGIATKYTTAIIGEAGDEAILPLNHRNMGMLADGIVTNMGTTEIGSSGNILKAIEEAAYRGYSRAIKEASTKGQTNVNVTLNGDAGKIFEVVREEDKQFYNRNHRGAFSH